MFDILQVLYIKKCSFHILESRYVFMYIYFLVLLQKWFKLIEYFNVIDIVDVLYNTVYVIQISITFLLINIEF